VTDITIGCDEWHRAHTVLLPAAELCYGASPSKSCKQLILQPLDEWSKNLTMALERQSQPASVIATLQTSHVWVLAAASLLVGLVAG
jgi:hypothetical protein